MLLTLASTVIQDYAIRTDSTIFILIYSCNLLFILVRSNNINRYTIKNIDFEFFSIEKEISEVIGPKLNFCLLVKFPEP